MLSKFKSKREIEQPSKAWLTTFADLLSLILAFFVLVYSISTLDGGSFDNISNSLSQGFLTERSSQEPIKIAEQTANTIKEEKVEDFFFVYSVFQQNIANMVAEEASLASLKYNLYRESDTKIIIEMLEFSSKEQVRDFLDVSMAVLSNSGQVQKVAIEKQLNLEVENFTEAVENTSSHLEDILEYQQKIESFDVAKQVSFFINLTPVLEGRENIAEIKNIFNRNKQNNGEEAKQYNKNYTLQFAIVL